MVQVAIIAALFGSAGLFSLLILATYIYYRRARSAYAIQLSDPAFMNMQLEQEHIIAFGAWKRYQKEKEFHSADDLMKDEENIRCREILVNDIAAFYGFEMEPKDKARKRKKTLLRALKRPFKKRRKSSKKRTMSRQASLDSLQQETSSRKTSKVPKMSTDVEIGLPRPEEISRLLTDEAGQRSANSSEKEERSRSRKISKFFDRKKESKSRKDSIVNDSRKIPQTKSRSPTIKLVTWTSKEVTEPKTTSTQAEVHSTKTAERSPTDKDLVASQGGIQTKDTGQPDASTGLDDTQVEAHALKRRCDASSVKDRESTVPLIKGPLSEQLLTKDHGTKELNV